MVMELIDINRRRFLGLLAAPAIVRASSLMMIVPAKSFSVEIVVNVQGFLDPLRFMVAGLEDFARQLEAHKDRVKFTMAKVVPQDRALINFSDGVKDGGGTGTRTLD